MIIECFKQKHAISSYKQNFVSEISGRILHYMLYVNYKVLIHFFYNTN